MSHLLFLNPPAPDLLEKALNLNDSAVTTYMLKAYQSASLGGSTAEVLTLWLGYVPTSVVSDLQSQMSASNSAFYNQTGLIGELAAQVDSSYPLVSTSNLSSSSSSSSGTSSGVGDQKKDIIIGVTVSIGGALWVLLVVWIYRRMRRNAKADIHRRMSMNPTLSGRNLAAVQMMQERDRGHGTSSSVDLDARPSSFYAFGAPRDERTEVQGDNISVGGSSRCVAFPTLV